MLCRFKEYNAPVARGANQTDTRKARKAELQTYVCLSGKSGWWQRGPLIWSALAVQGDRLHTAAHRPRSRCCWHSGAILLPEQRICRLTAGQPEPHHSLAMPAELAAPCIGSHDHSVALLNCRHGSPAESTLVCPLLNFGQAPARPHVCHSAALAGPPQVPSRGRDMHAAALTAQASCPPQSRTRGACPALVSCCAAGCTHTRTAPPQTQHPASSPSDPQC